MTDTEYLNMILTLFQKKYHAEIKQLSSVEETLTTDVLLYMLYKYNLLPYILIANMEDKNFESIANTPKVSESSNIKVTDECKEFIDVLNRLRHCNLHIKNKNESYSYLISYIFLNNTSLQAYKTLRSIFKPTKYTEILNIVNSHVYEMFNMPKEDIFIKYGRFLTVPSPYNKHGRIVGRDKEISQIVDIMSRKDKNNVVLVGNAGVGKTALVEGFAELIMSDKCPEQFKEFVVYELSLSSLISGTTYRGDFEERLTTLLKTLMSYKNIVLFIDEIHNIMSSGSDEHSSGLVTSEMLKPYMSRNGLYIIGATTPQEYRIMQEDKAMVRRFSCIQVSEPSNTMVFTMLQGNLQAYIEHFNIDIDESILDAVIIYANKYITNRYMPDKAFELLDNACVHCINHTKNKSVSLDDVHYAAELLCNMTIPKHADTNKIKQGDLLKYLNSHIIGQSESINIVLKKLKRYYIGLHNPTKPIASFLFVGSTGVGKTQLCKELAEQLFTKESFLKLDMSEYAEQHSVAKLIGAPPGYVGYEKGGILTDFVNNHPHSVILFDEIEKAHPDINNILLQILDEGRLTDNMGNTSNFSNCIIVLTSNIGANEVNQSKHSVGFNTETDNKQIKHTYTNAVKKYFKPELLGRLEVVYFNTLTNEDKIKIIDMEIDSIIHKFKDMQIDVSIFKKVRQYMYDKFITCEYGAREIKYKITDLIENTVVDYITDSDISAPYVIKLYDYKDDTIICK